MLKIKSLPWKAIFYTNKFPFMPYFFQKIYFNLFKFPKILKLHINTECNYNCIYCYVERGIKSLSTNKWESLIEQADKLGVDYIDFIGGEPFLHKDFYKLLKYASKKNMGITVFTNGSLLNDEWIEKIRNLEVQTILAVKYNYNATLYHQITGRGDLFYKIESNIKKCVKKDIPVIAHTTITQHNVKYANEIARKCIEMGAYPFFEPYIPIKKPVINQRLEIDKKEWSNAIRIVERTYSGVLYIPETAAILRRGLCSCFVDVISVTADGFVFPCPYASEDLCIGNVKYMSLKEIWNECKERRKEWKRIPQACKSCEYKYICGGGCKLYTYLKHKNFDFKDPLCTKVAPPTLGVCAFSIIHSKLYQKTKEKIKLLNNDII